MASRKRGTAAALTTTAASVVTSGALEAITLAKVIACNTGASTRSVTLYQVAAAGSATAANMIVNQQTILANQTVTVSVSAVFLAQGAALYAKQDTGTDVTLSVNYTVEDQSA